MVSQWKMVKKHYGDPQLIESRIQMAHELGMAALSLGSVNVDCIFRENQKVEDGSTRYAGGSLKSLDQLDQLKQPDWSKLIIELKEKRAKINQAGLAGVLYMPWCFHAINTSMGFEHLCYKLYEDRGFLKTCMSWLEERNREAIEEVVSAVKPDAILFDGDCAYGSGLMISPDDLKDLTYDETAKTVKLLQQLDIPYTIHSDGKLDDLIPVLIDLGFSAIHGCEKQADKLEHLVEKFGDH
jgi:hypothetical protein